MLTDPYRCLNVGQIVFIGKMLKNEEWENCLCRATRQENKTPLTCP
jgi:hypothetical protein